MKAIAKREKAAKKRALAHNSQLQGMLQGMQLTAAGNFVQAPTIMSSNRRYQSVQPTMLLNAIPTAPNVTIPILEEDHSTR